MGKIRAKCHCRIPRNKSNFVTYVIGFCILKLYLSNGKKGAFKICIVINALKEVRLKIKV